MARKKKGAGPRGPTKVTPAAIAKLEQAYSNDMTDEEACLYAGISTTSLYNYQKKNPEFVERKQHLKNALALHAKNNIAKKIHKGDESISKWWLERRRKEDYSTRAETKTNIEGGLIISIDQILEGIDGESTGLPSEKA